MSNRFDKDLVDCVVRVKRNGSEDLFMCVAGSGCFPDVIGSTVFGYWLSDNRNDHIDEADIESIENKEK